MKKRVMSLLLTLVLVLGLAACTTTDQPSTEDSAPESTVEESTGEPAGSQEALQDESPSEGGYTPGTYSATATSMKGPLTLEVTVSDSAITGIAVTDCADTPGIAGVAIDQVIGRIVAEQSLAVDITTGATMTSRAILAAAETALTEAGGNMAELKLAPAPGDRAQGPDQEVDVVIVGSGGAGLAAAIAASRDTGLNVLVVEKLDYIGGSTGVAGGGVWTIGSRFNEESGVDSSAQDLISFMEMRSGVELNRELLTNIAAVAGPTFDYLLDNGFPIVPDYYGKGHPDSNLSTASMDSGDGDYETGAGGRLIVDSLAEYAKNEGAQIRLGARAVQLEVNDGVVEGIHVEEKETAYLVKAKKVILATGGFTRNEALIEELNPDYTGNVPFTGAGSTGDGIEMTRDLDVVIVGEGMMGIRGTNMNYGYYGPVGSLVYSVSAIVNQEGELFDTGSFYSEMLLALNQQTGKHAFGISDSTHPNVAGLENGIDYGVVVKADTIEALSEQMGIPLEALEASLEEKEVSEGPFYCVTIRPTFIGSIPGLQVTGNAEVLTSSGEVIPNLYAAGELTFGNIYSKWYPASGSGVGGAIYTGTIAGNHAKDALAD